MSPAAGGVPDIRRKYRTRPAGVTSAAVFDVSRDWAAEYAHATGNAWHADVHFVQEYSEQLLDQLSSVQPALPSALAAWADVKVNGGRDKYRRLFMTAAGRSALTATPDSLAEAQVHERRIRGARALAEDPSGS